jgi:hypothetical protein
LSSHPNNNSGGSRERSSSLEGVDRVPKSSGSKVNGKFTKVFNLEGKQLNLTLIEYCKVASSNKSRLEAYAGFFRLLMKGIFDPYFVL